MINQVNKDYDCPQMAAYVEEVRKLESRFKGLRFEHVKRKDNFVADELSKWAAERSKVPPGVFVQRQSKPSVDPKTVAGEAPPATEGDPAAAGNHAAKLLAYTSRKPPPWGTDIIRYLRGGTKRFGTAFTGRQH